MIKRIVPLLGAMMAASPVIGCSCINGLTACGQLSTAKVAFIGTVIKGTEDSTSATQNTQREGPAVVRIETIVRGLEPRTTEIKVNPSIQTSCYFPMHAGERWLILGGLDGDTVNTGGCTGSRTLGANDPFIQDAIESFLKGPNLVQAEVRKYQGSETRWNKDALLSGAEIVLHGSEGSWSGTTNEKGQVQFRGVPQGDYEIEATSPGLSLGLPEDSRWSTPEKFSPKIKVNGVGCVQAPLTLWLDQGISGVVRDEQGKPVAGVNVGAFEVRSENRVSSSSFRTTTTDSQGQYQLPRVPDGTYVIGANAEEGYDESAYGAKYYPAVASTLAAARVVLKGEGLEDIDVLMDSPRRRIEMLVKIVFPSGKPAPQAYISIARDDVGSLRPTNERDEPYTNADGIAKLRLWEGDTYTLSAITEVSDPSTKRVHFISSDRVREVARTGVFPVITLQSPK